MSKSPLRIWPGVAVVAVVWLSRFAAPLLGVGASTEFLVRVLGGLAGGAAVAVWWLAFSRAPWSERLGIVGLLIAALGTTWLVGDRSIQVWIFWYSGPLLGLALVGSVALTSGLDPRRRRAAIAAALVPAVNHRFCSRRREVAMSRTSMARAFSAMPCGVSRYI